VKIKKMKKFITLEATLLVLSCNSSGNKTDKTSGNEKTSVSDRPGYIDTPDKGLPGAEITVGIKGGPNAGNYSARSAETTCSEGLTGDNSFGNQYSESGKADNELSTLQLIIDDKNAAKNGTDKFSIQVAFGKILGGKSYSNNTRDDNSGKSNEGSGTAILTESGGTKIVVIQGKTANGVGISATIKCNSIITAG
jgi:hypothetical protein